MYSAQCVRPTHRLVAVLVLAGVGCRTSSTDPAANPVSPPPSGLAASLQISQVTAPDTVPRGPTVANVGDSVVATALLPYSACRAHRVDAGVAGGVLVVTIVDSATSQVCTLQAAQAVFRATVRPAPAGAYDVSFRFRLLAPPSAPSETEIVRRPVTVRE